MKKALVVFAVVLAILAFVSCKQEPASTPEPAPAEENGGVLTVRPASSDVTWGNTDRFQFVINQEYAEWDTIEFLVKLSDSFASIVPRSGDSSTSWPKFATLAISSLEQDDDGWYIVSTTATDAYTQLGITAYLKEGAVQDENLFISIKNLKIDGVLIDFSEYDAATCVAPLVDCPDALVATIEE